MNNKYDNVFSDTVLAIIGTLVRTMERAIVIFWDGLRNATEHGTPSLLGFVAAFLPILTPLPVAGMTAISLTKFFGWDLWQSVTMAIALEGIGFVLWVFLTESLLNDGWKGTVIQYFFGASVLTYESVLIAINAGLSAQAGESTTFVFILLMLCILPALSSVAFGYRNHSNTDRLDAERQEEKDMQERIRQEKREDRKELQKLKLGYASDTKREELKANPFRGKRS